MHVGGLHGRLEDDRRRAHRRDEDQLLPAGDARSAEGHRPGGALGQDHRLHRGRTLRRAGPAGGQGDRHGGADAVQELQVTGMARRLAGLAAGLMAMALTIVDASAELIRKGFSPANLMQFSVRPELYPDVKPGKADLQPIYEGLSALAKQA